MADLIISLASSCKCYMFHRKIHAFESLSLSGCLDSVTKLLVARAVANPRFQSRVSVVYFPFRWKMSTWALTAGWAPRTVGPSLVSLHALISVPTPTRTHTTCTMGALWYVCSIFSFLLFTGITESSKVLLKGSFA